MSRGDIPGSTLCIKPCSPFVLLIVVILFLLVFRVREICKYFISSSSFEEVFNLFFYIIYCLYLNVKSTAINCKNNYIILLILYNTHSLKLSILVNLT